MRLELDTNLFLGTILTSAFVQGSYSKAIDRSKQVINTFKNITNFSHNMNGGVGRLQGAMQSIDQRAALEAQKAENLETVKKHTGDFIRKAGEVDRKVAGLIWLSQREFYRVNPWAKPPVSPDKKSWLEKAWGYACGKAKEIGKAIIKFGKKVIKFNLCVLDTLNKVRQSISQFCKDHWKSIVKVVVAVVVVVGLFALSVVTGGAAAAIFTAAAHMALAGALVGAGVGAAKGAVEYAFSEGEHTAGGFFGAMFDGAADGALSGAISGAVSGATSALGPVLMSACGVSKGLAIAGQIVGGGILEGIGGVFELSVDYALGDKKSDEGFKGFLKDAGKTFVIEFGFGMVSEGLSIGGDAVKHSIASKLKIGSDPKSVKGLKKLLVSDTLWYSSTEAAADELKNFTRKSATQSFKDYLKDQGKDAFSKSFDKSLKKGLKKLAGFEILTGIDIKRGVPFNSDRPAYELPLDKPVVGTLKNVVKYFKSEAKSAWMPSDNSETPMFTAAEFSLPAIIPGATLEDQKDMMIHRLRRGFATIEIGAGAFGGGTGAFGGGGFRGEVNTGGGGSSGGYGISFSF